MSCSLGHKFCSNLYEHVVILDLDRETAELHGWIVNVAAGRKIVLPTMPWANYTGAINFTVSERPALVLTGIVDCVKLAVGVKQGNSAARDGNRPAAAFGDIAAPRCSYKLRQLVPLLR